MIYTSVLTAALTGGLGEAATAETVNIYSLRGKNIAVMNRTYAMQKLMAEGLTDKITYVATPNIGLEMVYNGSVDAFVDNTPSIQYHLQYEGFDCTKFTVSGLQTLCLFMCNACVLCVYVFFV